MPSLVELLIMFSVPGHCIYNHGPKAQHLSQGHYLTYFQGLGKFILIGIEPVLLRNVGSHAAEVRRAIACA